MGQPPLIDSRRCSFYGDATLLNIFFLSCVSDYFCPYLFLSDLYSLEDEVTVFLENVGTPLRSEWCHILE
jgi:hypothetical protein